MRRRTILRGLGLSVPAGVAGCTGVIAGDAETATGDPDTAGSCGRYAYDGPGASAANPYPWQLEIRDIGLSVYEVRVTISELSGGSQEAFVSCDATAEGHARLVFELAPEAEYRVHVELNRPGNPEEVATTVTGGELIQKNTALVVSVDRDTGLSIEQLHYDQG